MSRFLEHSSLAVTTTYLRRLEGQEDRSWAKVAEAIGVLGQQVANQGLDFARRRRRPQGTLLNSKQELWADWFPHSQPSVISHPLQLFGCSREGSLIGHHCQPGDEGMLPRVHDAALIAGVAMAGKVHNCDFRPRLPSAHNDNAKVLLIYQAQEGFALIHLSARLLNRFSRSR
jgi:hypothetical protein